MRALEKRDQEEVCYGVSAVEREREEVIYRDSFPPQKQNKLFPISDDGVTLFPSQNQNQEVLYDGMPDLFDGLEYSPLSINYRGVKEQAPKKMVRFKKKKSKVSS